MGYLSQVGLWALLFSVSLGLFAEEVIQKQVKVLGKKVSVTQKVSDIKDDVEDEVSQSGVESATEVSLFRKKFEITKTSVKYRVSENEGMSFDNNFYVNGRKILAHGLVNGDGSFAYSADIPAAEISGDIFSYSIGILSVGINSGVTYDGSLNAEISSELLKDEPVLAQDMNLVSASAQVDVLAKGFIEGQVKILFIKAGVGGALNLIDGEAGASISVTPNNISNPAVSYQGVVHLLSGELYGYLGSGRAKWLSRNFYKSNGRCYAFGDSACPN